MKTSSLTKFFPNFDVIKEPKLPFDNKLNDDWTDDGVCTSCRKPLSDHSPKKIVKCALAELRGERKN